MFASPGRCRLAAHCSASRELHRDQRERHRGGQQAQTPGVFPARRLLEEAARRALSRREQRHQEARQQRDAERQRLQHEREQEERAAAVLERLSDAQRETYRHRARERLPALMHDMDGFVTMHMRYLVIASWRMGS